MDAERGKFNLSLHFYAVAGYYYIGVKYEDMGTQRMQPDVSGEYVACI